MWVDVSTLRRNGYRRIVNNTSPQTINFSTLFSKNDVFNKHIFPVSGDVITNVNVYGWNIVPYNVSENKFMINPYMTNRGLIYNTAEKCIPITGGEYVINMSDPIDHLSISFSGKDMFASSWSYAYRASVYLNDKYVGKVIANAGIFVSPMSNEVKQIPAPVARSTRGNVSGTMISSSLELIDLPSTNTVKVNIRDVEFHGSLAHQGIFTVTILGRTGGEKFGKTACNTDIFVFGS